MSTGLAIARDADGLRFWIHVTPRARRPGVGGTHGDALRVAVVSPPVAGAANRACVDALAEALACRRSDVTLDPAARGRRKRVAVRGDPAILAARLQALAAHPGGD